MKTSPQKVVVSRVDGDNPGEVASYDYSSPVIGWHRVGVDRKLDADRWMREAFTEAGDSWGGPGRYRIVVTATYSGAVTDTFEWDLPVAPEWATLTNSQRMFGFTVLANYPGTTPGLVARFLSVFGQHYRVEIDSAELTRLTGYALPEGVRRPRHPGATADEVRAKP